MDGKVELRHLRYFVAVAELGGFTAAAQHLHTAQPSLSRQIRDLEAYVGTALFERSSRHVELTEAGQVFLDEARLALAQAQRAVENARKAARDHAQRLTIGFVFGVEAEQLLRVMNTLHGGLNHLQLALHTESSPVLITELLERKIEAAFIRPSIDSQSLNIRTLRTEKLIAAVPADHPLARQPTIHLAQLAAAPLIGVPREHAPVLYDAIEQYADQYGVTLTPVFNSQTLMMALSLITSVGGVSLLPEHSARMFPQGVVAVPMFEETPLIELALAWHPENRSPALAAFISAFSDLEPSAGAQKGAYDS